MEKIDEFIDYSAANQEELRQIAKTFGEFTAQQDFEILARLVVSASSLLETKDSRIPNLEELSEVVRRCHKLKGHIN
jgi:hypothetical protein